MSLNFNNIRVLLIGDFMIDKYVYGQSVRMSPEAPVPVLIPERSYSMPGGAGNVALNLSSLGASVSCVGYVGSDREGDELINFLQKNGIDTKHIYKTKFQTTSKKRFYSNGKQVLRVDNEEIIKNWSPPSLAELKINRYDLIILSDYNKGVLNNSWFSKIQSENIFVDPKKNDFSFYSNADIITPNLNELERAVGKKIKDDKTLISVCKKMVMDLNLKFIVAKQGERGMTIVGQEGFFKTFEAHHIDNPDVTGAGDTVISVFSLAYTQTRNADKSAKIANAAAASAVSKPGTATVTIDDINKYIKIDE